MLKLHSICSPFWPRDARWSYDIKVDVRTRSFPSERSENRSTSCKFPKTAKSLRFVIKGGELSPLCKDARLNCTPRWIWSNAINPQNSFRSQMLRQQSVPPKRQIGEPFTLRRPTKFAALRSVGCHWSTSANLRATYIRVGVSRDWARSFCSWAVEIFDRYLSFNRIDDICWPTFIFVPKPGRMWPELSKKTNTFPDFDIVFNPISHICDIGWIISFFTVSSPNE